MQQYNHATVYQALLEQLGTYSEDLRNVERAFAAADAQQMSEDLHIRQEHERKEIAEQIVECACYINTSRVNYQRLIDDLYQFEVVSKAMEDVIANSCMVIAKAQALIQDHELKLANEKRKEEELETTMLRVQKELGDHSSKLEALQTQLTSKKFLSDEELRVQALAEVEKACQKDISALRTK